MERTLDLDTIRQALGSQGRLPTPEELQQALARAEIDLFMDGAEVADDLLASAWFLHSVGTAREALEIYSTGRQRRANQVAAHILDLALQAREWSYVEQLQLTFAAQVSSLRGDVDPNARAIYRRLAGSRTSLRESPGVVSLEIGTALLALDRRLLFERLQNELRGELRSLVSLLRRGDTARPTFELLGDTPFASAAGVLEGSYDLLVHLTYNRPERAARARTALEAAVNATSAQGDLDSRWVAAHLLDLIQDLKQSSVWALLPEGTSPEAGRAMTLGEPPVLTLWPPQVELFGSSPSPLDPEVRRLILALPTSAGKTLIAQYLIAAHLARRNGGACVIVPTHSLAREVRRDLDRRLDVMATRATDGGPLGLSLDRRERPRAVVMTPEKLSARLRVDPDQLLEEYSLFVIDEAHLVGDRERGWTLESAVSFLHNQTRTTSHRLVLLSAAMGNRSHFKAWMEAGARTVSEFHKDWRGPRRIHAIATTTFRSQDEYSYEEPRTSRGLRRRIRPIYGQISIRTGPAGSPVHLITTEPVGEVLWKRRQNRWEYDSDRSTKQYERRVFMAEQLGKFGSVLIVESTKQMAQRFALSLAESVGESSDSLHLVALATNRLGREHLLVRCLRCGVAFHHAALPEDVQAELEDAVRAGTLRYLVSTTTLVEGINLPVRSVLVGSRGYRRREGEVEILDTPKLLNAIGRAGRAGKESEGWVVLAEQQNFKPKMFHTFDPADEDLEVLSCLATETALEALDAFEELVRQGEDAVFQLAGREAEGFVSYVWFLASVMDEFSTAIEDPIGEALQATFAWQQLDEDVKNRWLEVRQETLRAYQACSEIKRRRWATAGTSLPTAATLGEVAEELVPLLGELADAGDPVSSFKLLAGDDRLARLLELRESSHGGFRRTRTSSKLDIVDVDYLALILDWLGGSSLGEIGRAHLFAVESEDFRYEQLSEFSTRVLEHLLPWLFGILVAWLNEEEAIDPQVCPELPGYIRFGVSTPAALELMLGGVRSRRLAKVVSDQFPGSGGADDLRTWLGELGLLAWKEAFAASPSELSDLLVFAKEPDARLISKALAGEQVRVPLTMAGEPQTGTLTLRPLEEPAPSRLGLWAEGTVVAFVAERYHDDVARLLRLGVPLELRLKSEERLLVLRAREPEGDPEWFTT